MTSKPTLLPPKMLAQYIARAERGDYQFRIADDIFCWFIGNQKVTLLHVPGSVYGRGHIVQHSASSAASEKKSLARAQQLYEEKSQKAAAQ